MKKLKSWLALIKVADWIINYQKWQYIYKEVYFILKINCLIILNQKKKKKLLNNNNNNNNNNNLLLTKICYKNIVN